ncbi:Uracil phosphoribosyltransferase [subsurface metagenome]
MSKNALIGFLLIHGFASTKYSFQILVDSLKEKDYVVDALDLPGHNTSPQDMIGVKWTDWTDYCQNCLDNLKEKCKKVYIIGTSLGGTLTLYLGSTNPDVDGLIALATPYKSFNSKMKMLEKGRDFRIDGTYVNIPYLEDKVAIIVDPMLASGSTILYILNIIKEQKPKKIIILCAIASQYGIERIQSKFQDSIIIAGAVDSILNEKGYIIPGLGDAGDRAFNT